MKRTFVGLILLLFSVFTSGCFTTAFLWSDGEIANDQLNQILESLESGDKETLRELFAPNAVDQQGNFDKNLDELFGYFQGKDSSYEEGPLGADKTREDGYLRKVIDTACDVTTSADTYRIAISYVETDDLDADNEGIWSLYIIRMDDDTEPDYTYWGDGKNTPGIHIAMPRPEHE